MSIADSSLHFVSRCRVTVPNVEINRQMTPEKQEKNTQSPIINPFKNQEPCIAHTPLQTATLLQNPFAKRPLVHTPFVLKL